MSSQGSPAKETLLPWLKKVPSNEKSIATFMSNVDPKDQVYKKEKSKIKRKINSNKPSNKATSVKKSRTTNVDFNEQRRLTEYISHETNHPTTPENENDKNFGSRYTSKPSSSIRFWYTNPNGIGVNWKASKSHASFSFLKNKSKADVIGLAETNVNWNMMKNASSLYSRVKNNWKYFRTVTSNNLMEKKPSLCQRGGTCAIAVSQVSHRVLRTGKDPSKLGRWTWIEFGGRDNYLSRFYCAYRPGKKPPKTKLTTVVDQHLRYIGKQNLQTTPIEMFDNDLINELNEVLSQGVNVVLAIDVNENVENGKFTNKLCQIGMTNAYKSLFDDSRMPPTHHTGSQPISTIYHSANLNIVNGGILPKGCGFQADHRNMFVDIDEESFLGSTMFAVTPPPMKRLQLNDPRIVKRFNKHVIKHIKANNMEEKMKALNEIMSYPPDANMIQNMEKIDEQLGRAIVKGLKKCRKLRVGKIPFSGLFKKLWKEKRLWILVYKKKVGQVISATTIKRLAKGLSYENPMSLPLKEVERLRQQAEKRYQALIPHSRTERQQFFEDLACANAESSNSSKASILRRIMNTED